MTRSTVQVAPLQLTKSRKLFRLSFLGGLHSTLPVVLHIRGRVFSPQDAGLDGLWQLVAGLVMIVSSYWKKRRARVGYSGFTDGPLSSFGALFSESLFVSKIIQGTCICVSILDFVVMEGPCR